ncbi:hypothetical protein RDI58_014430 [Solanum bulbocastanum]|uniref:Leucine-rich repeat-containing N-terminal plant-type domain-containing protein n=1 Tax=Solanum bulbocastanum TaxID=147425 RepID=A0AAN8YAJ9_SOLBU
MVTRKILSALQCLTLLYLFTVTFASTEEPTALLKWKATFKNQNNSLLASWTPSSNACREWYGDICFNGRVNTLNITNSSVIGTLYAFPFSSLPFLENLDLRMNNFTGTIPPEIGNLTNLVYLNLNTNQISGTIPPQIGSLAKLQTLRIYDNHLNGPIPGEIGHLRSLTRLSLGGNFLNGSIPASFGNLNNLSILYLYDNHLSGSIPQCFGNISSLQVLMMSHNNLSGEIPSSISNLTSLRILDLGRNNLEGAIPQCLGNIRGLQVFDMQNNKLSGTLPTNFSNGSSLISLNLHGNELEGKIPRSLANCKMLQVLDLGDNQLNDTFPMWLGTLTELRVLRLTSNKLHGPIRSLGAEIMFPDLRIIDLSYNAFSKDLPTSLFQHFKGMRTIVKTMEEHERVNGFYYQDSTIVVTKGLKLEVVKILSLYTVINLSNNKFEGHIPGNLGDLIAIRVLNLSHNGLQGHIPPSLGSLSVVESLDLSFNHLSGEIPQQLASLTSLEFLNLSHNHLQGCIPQGPQFLTFESNSYEGNDGLSGFPVSKGCGNHHVSETNYTASALDDQESNSEFLNDFWKAALMGYGGGLCIGLSIMYFMISTGNPKWLARIIEEMEHKINMRRRKKQRGQRNYRRRNNRF